jgi:hypothetical protein
MIMLLKVSFSNLQLILSILRLEKLNKQFLVIHINSIEKRKKKTERIESIIMLK